MSARGADNSTFTAKVNKRRATRRLQGRSERGAALVEAAIIFLPLCLIVFGIIEYGFIFKDSLTISSATRAGARTASAVPFSSDTQFYENTLKAVTVEASGLTFKGGEQLFVYKADGNGVPLSGNLDSCTISCQGYTWNNGSKTWARTSGNGWALAARNACLGTADSVGIRLMIKHDALSGFFKNMDLKEKTVMRFEPQSNCS